MIFGSGYKKKKRGSIFDIIGIIVVAFIFILVAVLSFKLLGSINVGIQNSSFSNESKVQLQSNTDRFPSVFDGGFAFLFFGLFIITLISAYFINTHPVFFIAVLILLIVVGVISAFLGNGLESILADNSELSASSFPIMQFVSSHFISIFSVMLVAIGVIGFAKARTA